MTNEGGTDEMRRGDGDIQMATIKADSVVM